MGEPHSWYGPCDAMGPNGECSECERPRFTDEAFERWLQSKPAEARAPEPPQLRDPLLVAQHDAENANAFRVIAERKLREAEAQLATLREALEKREAEWRETRTGSERWIAAHRLCAAQLRAALRGQPTEGQ